MRILFLSDRYPPAIGGVAASASRIAGALVRSGHQVEVVVSARELPGGAVESQEGPPGLVVHRCGPARSADYTQQQTLLLLEWLHRRRPFDLVWGHYLTTAGFLAAWFGRQTGLPSLLAVRGNDFDKQLFPPGDFGRLDWCLRHAARIACVSQDLARKVRALVDREAFVLPNSVDSELFQPGPRDPELAARYRLDPAEITLGFSGELRAKKGLAFLIQCFRELHARQPARLLVVGQVRGSDRGELDRLLDDPELRSRLTITDHLPDPAAVAAHLRLIDVLLVPSLWDGMPNSLLEALAVGVPVVASDAGAIPEVVADGVHGLLVPRTHLHQLSRRVDEYLALPGETRRTMLDAGRRLVQRCYSPAAEAARLAELLSPFTA